MAKINLAPDVRQEKLKNKKRNFTVTLVCIVLIGAALLFILLLQGYRWSRIYSLDQTKKKIENTKDELKSYKNIEEMVVNIEQGLKAVQEIEKSEPKWSRFLPVLEKVTPNDVRFTEFSMEGSKFTAKAEGRQVSSIARVIKSLENYKYKASEQAESGRTLFKNVNVDGYEAKDGLVNFDITFEMEQGVLW